MYNKLFTKILDSSIWLEPASTRLVWLTFLAAMDSEGFVQFASVANLSHRARVSLEEAEAAVKCLESDDPNSSDPDFGGRRAERVPGGWMVLNADKYRGMVTRAIIQEQTRLRVAKHRDKKRCNATVTPSEAISDTKSKSKSKEEAEALSLSAKQPSAPSVITNDEFSKIPFPETIEGIYAVIMRDPRYNGDRIALHNAAHSMYYSRGKTRGRPFHDWISALFARADKIESDVTAKKARKL